MTRMVNWSFDHRLHRRLKAYGLANGMSPTAALAHVIASLSVEEIEIPEDLETAVTDESLVCVRVTADTRSMIRGYAKRAKMDADVVIQSAISKLLIDEKIRENGVKAEDGVLLGPGDVEPDKFYGPEFRAPQNDGIDFGLASFDPAEFFRDVCSRSTGRARPRNRPNQ